jgi:hypothetical protein
VTAKPKASIYFRAEGPVSGSAIAIGDGSSARLTTRSDLPPAVLKHLTELVDNLIDRLGDSADDEVRADAAAVRAELEKKKINLGLLRPALKGIAASLGAAQSLSDLVTNILSLVSRLK